MFHPLTEQSLLGADGCRGLGDQLSCFSEEAYKFRWSFIESLHDDTYERDSPSEPE